MSNIDQEIAFCLSKIAAIKRESENFEKKLESLNEIKTKFPDAELHYKSIASSKVNDEVSCMVIEDHYSAYYIKFHTTRKLYGKPIYSLPFRIKIAEIETTGYYPKMIKQLKIFNYENLINNNIKRKPKFITRVKKFLVKNIVNRKLTISDDSFNREYFTKLLTLV